MSLILVSNVTMVYATEAVMDIQVADAYISSEVKGIDDLNIQLDELYHRVGEELNINYLYVKILHMIAGGKAVYADTLPYIYVDQTADSLPGAFDIAGASQSYDRMAPWATCPDDTIERPSKYYLPDAAYNVTADIVSIMNSRYVADRGRMQTYFDALDISVKNNILFCEAVLQYTGSSIESVNSFHSIYEKLIYDKDYNENVLECTADYEYIFKPKFETIIRNNGINTDRELEILSHILRFDSKLAASAYTSDLASEYIFPYKVGYTSRENMMLAAMSIVGKCRYVWGGGHLRSGAIEGINPAWELFNDTYGQTPDEPGYSNCIRPNNGWCPIHETVNGGNGCLLVSNVSHSAEEYITEREEFMNTESLNKEAFTKMLNDVNIQEGVASHRLDGLDCSGYASWLYNQITDYDFSYDSGALNFINQKGITSLGVGKSLLPGDVFSWGDHIIVIVGKVADDSRAYVMVESGPSVVKFGVAFYAGAKATDISYAAKIAKEANKLIGDINSDESTRIFNMTNLIYTGADDDDSGTVDPRYGYHDCGRLSEAFIDESVVLPDFNKKMVDMTAIEIIQHTVDNLPYQYVSGVKDYSGELFDIGKFEEVFNDIETAEVIPEEIILHEELTEIN